MTIDKSNEPLITEKYLRQETIPPSKIKLHLKTKPLL